MWPPRRWVIRHTGKIFHHSRPQNSSGETKKKQNRWRSVSCQHWAGGRGWRREDRGEGMCGGGVEDTAVTNQPSCCWSLTTQVLPPETNLYKGSCNKKQNGFSHEKWRFVLLLSLFLNSFLWNQSIWGGFSLLDYSATFEMNVHLHWDTIFNCFNHCQISGLFCFRRYRVKWPLTTESDCAKCHSDTETADQTCYFIQSQYTNTRPTSLSTDPTLPGAWQGSNQSISFKVTGMTWPGKQGLTPEYPLSMRTPYR